MTATPARTPGRPCRALREPAADGAVPGWATYRRIAAGEDFDARLGLLGDELARGGGCVRPIGPGAALAAATSAGTVTGYAPYDARTLPRAAGGLPGDLRRRRRGARPGRRGPGATRSARRASRAAQVRAVDARVGQVLAAAPAGADVLVASLSDAGESERLRLAALRGPGRGPRHAGVHLHPAGRAGPARRPHRHGPGPRRPARTRPASAATRCACVPADGTSAAAAADRLQRLVDYDQASHEVHSLVPPFFNGWVIVQILIYAFVAVVWRRRWGSEDTRLRLLRLVPAGGDHRRRRARVDLPGQPAAVVALQQPDARRRRLGRRVRRRSSPRSPCSARGAARCSGRPPSSRPPRWSCWPPT